jgi:PRTRC genetic system protein E
LSRDTQSASGRHCQESEDPALTTALSDTGTEEELDTELGRELAGCVERHRALGSTLAAAKAEMDAAAKAVKEEARKKAEELKKKQGSADLRPALAGGLQLDWSYWSRCGYSSGADFHSLAMGVMSQIARRATPWGGLAGASPGPTSHIRAVPQWSRVNQYCGMSAAQPMRRCGLTMASLPLDARGRI